MAYPRVRRQGGPLNVDLNAAEYAGKVRKVCEDRRLYLLGGRVGGHRDLAASATRVVGDERVGPHVLPSQQDDLLRYAEGGRFFFVLGRLATVPSNLTDCGVRHPPYTQPRSPVPDLRAKQASQLSAGAAGWSACRESDRHQRGWWGKADHWRVMRAIQVYEVGGPEVLQVAKVDQPRPGPDEAVVEVAASGVNFLDVYHREGRYSLPLPFTPGAEGAGTVVEVGPGVADVAVGDRVGWVEIPGTYAERAVVDSSRLVPLPDDIGFETAAAVLLQGMTAHYLVKDAYPVQGGDTVLVHAAAGGMGLLLTQLITHLGGRVIGTTSTTAKAELAKRAGAAEVILSSAVDDLAAEVRRLNGGQGLPVVFDGVGAHTFDASLASLRTRGHLVLFGAASGAVPPFDPIRLAHGGSLTLIRPSLGHFIADRSELLRRAADVFEWVRSKALEVTVTGRYALSEAAQAHSDLEARRTTGKLLVIPDAAAMGRREETQS